MDFKLENQINHFISVRLEPFTLADIQMYLKSVGVFVKSEIVSSFLKGNGNLFFLDEDLYLGRAGAFTGKQFCIIPRQYEIDNKLLITGHRCIPFANFDMHPAALQFVYRNEVLPKRVIEIEMNRLYPYFLLFGKEYISQYILSDDANSDLNTLDDEFALPSRVKITVSDLQPIFQRTTLRAGSRILARVLDWNSGIIELCPVVTNKTGNNPFDQDAREESVLNWYTELEDCLLESFPVMGPCASIDEQLLNVFFHFEEQLCVPNCGAVEELLSRTTKIGFSVYGVETRLWYKDKEIPVVGQWNESNGELRPTLYELLLSSLLSSDCYVVDSVIRDALYRGEKDVVRALKRLLPETIDITPRYRSIVQEAYQNYFDDLAPRYNRFADHVYAEYRPRVISLLTQFLELSQKIEGLTNDMHELTTHPVVTFQQMIGHIIQLLETFTQDPDILHEEELAAMWGSLDGIESSFPGLRAVLLDELDGLKKNNFTVI